MAQNSAPAAPPQAGAAAGAYAGIAGGADVASAGDAVASAGGPVVFAGAPGAAATVTRRGPAGPGSPRLCRARTAGSWRQPMVR